MKRQQKKQTFVINFDGILTDDNQFKIIESGPGMTNVGYSINRQNVNKYCVEEKLFIALLEFYDHVYIVSAKNDPKLYVKFGISEHFLDKYKNKFSAYSMNDFIHKKHQLNENGVVIINNQGLGLIEPYHFSIILIKAGIDLPIVNDSMMWKHFTIKATMSYILQQVSPELAPRQVIVNLNQLESSIRAIENMGSDYVVFKPFSGTRAEGIFIVPITQAREIVKWLGDQKKPDKIFRSPIQDVVIKERLYQLDMKITESSIKYCLAQDYLSPKLLRVENKKYRPTIRIVVVACYDPATEHLEIRMSEGYYKLPELPISSNEPSWRESVSFSKLNRELELQKYPELKVNTLRSGIHAQFNHPATVKMPVAAQKFIFEKIKSNLTRVYKYLFCTDQFTFYKAILNDQSMSRFARDVTKLVIHKKLSNELCQLFAENNLNVVLILLHYIRGFVLKYENLPHPYLIPNELGELLIRYHANFGTDKLMQEVSAIAKFILGNIELLFGKNVSPEELELIMQILEGYAKNNFMPISANKIYKKATEFFRQDNFLEARSLFIKSIAIYKKDSKQQAICYYSLASCYIKLEHYADAVISSVKSLTLRQQLFTEDSDEVSRAKKKWVDAKELLSADNKARIGLKQFRKEAYGNAKDSFIEAIAQHSKLQDSSSRLALYYYNLGSCWLHLGMHNDAVKNYKRCLNMRKELLGKEHAATRKVGEKIKEVTQLLGDTKELQLDVS